MLPGSGGVPRRYRLAVRTGPPRSYRAVGLAYADAGAVNVLCARSVDPDCTARVRREILVGEPASPPVDVDAAHSVRRAAVPAGGDPHGLSLIRGCRAGAARAMGRSMLNRFLARQFARPSGVVGGLLVAPLLDAIGRPMMAEALAALAPEAGEAVLDLGVGGGWLSAQLLARGCRLTGVDPAPDVLARARRRMPAGCFLEGRAEALPLGRACLDRAASVNTLYFWPALDPGLRELARVLKPGGRLVLGFQTAEAVRAWPGHVYGFTAWAMEDVRAGLDAAGFRLVGETAARDWRVRDYVTLVALRGG